MFAIQYQPPELAVQNNSAFAGSLLLLVADLPLG